VGVVLIFVFVVLHKNSPKRDARLAGEAIYFRLTINH